MSTKEAENNNTSSLMQLVLQNVPITFRLWLDFQYIQPWFDAMFLTEGFTGTEDDVKARDLASGNRLGCA